MEADLAIALWARRGARANMPIIDNSANMGLLSRLSPGGGVGRDELGHRFLLANGYRKSSQEADLPRSRRGGHNSTGPQCTRGDAAAKQSKVVPSPQSG